MPLSEQEQRLLDEMERHLMGNDADVVSAPAEGRSLSYRNLTIGALLVVVGVIGLIIGVATQIPVVGVVVGVVAFVAMLAGVVLAVTPGRGRAISGAPRAGSGQRAPRAASQSFMDRMNDRWDKRNDER